jgi:hypothetical protein
VTSLRLWLVATHALSVLAGLAYLGIAVIGHADAPDANIGAGLALLWLGAIGSPWTWPLWTVPDVFGPLGTAWIIAAALLNLVLHATVSTWVSRRLTRRRLS